MEQPVENAPTFEVAGNGYTFTADELQKMEEGQRPVMKPKYGTPEYSNQKIEGDASNPYAGMTRQQAIYAVGKKFFNEWYGKDHTPETTQEVDGEQVKYGGLGAYDQIRAELAANNIVDPENYANVTKDIRRAYIQPVARKRVEELLSNFKTANHQNIDEIQGVFDSREAQQAINQDLERLGFAPTPEAYDGDEVAMHRDVQRYEQARQYYYQQLQNELQYVLVDKYGWLPSSDARSDVGGFRNEILSGGGKEHEERIRDREAVSMTQGYLSDAIKNEIEEFDKKAKEASGKAYRENTEGSAVTVGTPGYTGFGALGAVLYAERKGNEERDPDKIIASLRQKSQVIANALHNNGEGEEDYDAELDWLRNSAGPLLKNVLDNEKFLDESKKKAESLGISPSEYIMRYVFPNFIDALEREFQSEMTKKYMPKNTMEYILGGLEDSLVGMLGSGYVHTESQQRYKNMANAKYSEDTGLLTNALRTTVGFVADAPMWAAWGSMGGAVAKRQIAEYMLREASRRGVSLQVMQRAMAESANHYLGAAVGQRLMQGVPQMVITMGGAQATSEMARGIRDREELGEILKNTLGTAVTEGVKGGAIGAFTGVAHPYVDRLSGIGKVAGKAGSFAGEAGVFYTAGELEKLAKGEDAFGNPLAGLAESALNLALIKLTNMDNIKRYADAFLHPKKALEAKKGELIDEDVDMIRANADGAQFIDAITSMRSARTVPGAGEREGNLSTEEINAGAEAYRKMMVNPDIPFATKQKVARIVDGILPPPGKAVELDIEDGPSGESVLRTRDIDGQLLEEHRYDSREDADKAADAMRGELFANTTEALEGKVNSTDAYRRFTEYFENAYREASKKILRGEELTKAEQQAIYLHQHQDELLDIYKNVESGEELSEGGQSLAGLYRQHFEGFVNSGRALKEFTDAYEREHGLEPGSLHKALEKDVRTEEEVQMLLDYQEAMRQHVAEARDGDRIAEQETKDAEEADFEDVTGQRMLENSAPGNTNPAGVVFENGGAPSGGSGPGGSVDTAGGEAGANSGTGANDPSAAPSVTQRREAAYQRGAAAVQDTSTLPQVNYDLKLSIARMEQLFPSSNPVLSRLRSDVIKAVEAGDDAEADRLTASNSGLLNDSQREAIEQYRDMMETSRGLDDAITQQAQEYEQQRRAALEPLAAPDGSITELTLSDGSKAYYLAGNLNNTLGGVMIVTESGERKQIPVSQIKSVGERQMVSDVVSADVNSFAAQLEQQIEGLANGGDFTPGSQVDLMIAGRAFRATVAGKDGAVNILFTMEDGSQVPMSGNDARRAVYDADKAKIEAQLKQETDDAIAQQKAERFGKSIVGYAEGTPDLTAEGSDPKTVAEYLESRQDGQQLSEAEKAKHHAAVMGSVESEAERTSNQAEQAAETVRRLENKAAIDSLSEEETAALDDARASLTDARKRRRKWGEIRQALMTDEERRKFEADRQKEIRKAQTAVGGNEIAGQQTKEATGALPTGQELMEQFAEQGDAAKHVDSLREQLKIQHRDKLFPQLSAARDAVNDYRRGLTDASEAELRDMMARLANLEAEESAMVVRQQELGKLASSLGRLYAARNKAAMSPHERMMAAMEKESDPQKKMKLAREAFADDEEAMSVLGIDALEPQDVYEWVAAHLGKGSINWEGMQRGEHYVRGLRDELGRDKTRGIGKQYDTNGINYFLAPEGRGKGIEEIVHAIAEDSPYGTEEVRNALLDMLSSASKPSDITNRIVDDRIARADEVYEANLERARDAEEEARREAEDAAIMQMTGMTPEEYDAFMGDLEQRLAEQEGYRTSEEYFNQIAEDNDRENERRAGGSQEAGALAEQGQEGEPAAATPASEGGAGEADVTIEVPDADNIDKGNILPGQVYLSKKTGAQGYTTVKLRRVGVNSKGKTVYSGSKTNGAFVGIPAKELLSDEDYEAIFGDNKDGLYDENGIKVNEVRISPDGAIAATILVPLSTGGYETLEVVCKTNPLEHISSEQLTGKEVDAVVNSMKNHAGVSPFVEIANNTWKSNVETPLGDVKMGENQKEKLFVKGREQQYGMLLETLSKPDIVLEEKDKKQDIDHERPSSYLFVKTFQKPDGTKCVHFESVTVSQNGLEVSISSHIIRENQLKNKLKSDRLLYKATALDEPANSSAGQPINEGGGLSSAGKDTKNISNDQRKEEKSFSSRLAEAKEEVNVSPTDAQKEAGNYKKGHVSFGGYDYTIENPKGSVRSGVDRSGKPWSTTMQDTYGYILGKYGHDGDHIDMFINDDADLDSWNGRVFVVDQKSEDGSFDEHKVMYGYNNWKEAKSAYERNYSPGWWDSHVMQMMGVRKADFDKWLEDSDHKTKPFADYVRTKNGDPIRDNVDQLIADVRERVRHLPTWDADEIESMERERLSQLLKKRQKDLSVSRYLLKAAGVEGSGSAKERLLNNNIEKAEADIKALEAEQRRRIELREIGDAMVDNLEAMGFDVSTDPSENRRVRKKAEKDQSEEGKMRHFETPSGDIYGFTYRGKMYLDPTKIDAELPVHEYAHPWCEAFRRLNPEGWKGIVGLMKGDKGTWEFVKSVNPDLKSEDDIAEEMIAKFSGKKGAERAEAEYRRMNGRDSEYKSKWGNIWKNISNAIQDFWKQIGDFLHIKYTSAEQVYDQVVRDFANKINPRKRVEEWLRERDERYLQAVGNSDTSTAKELFDQALRENIGNGITPFIAVAGYRGKLQNLARGIKNRDPRVVSSVADLMAPLIPKDAVLVPAPSRKGTATDMLDLAQALSERTGAPVADVLRGGERGSQYEAKKAGRPLSVDDLGIKAISKLPDGKLPVVIDNVVDTGSTAEACVRALGKGIVVSLADSADRYKHVASLKSAEPVVTDKSGKVVPLSKRFELGGRYLEKAGTVNDMAMEASIVSMPRINQFGLNENDPVGRTLTGIKEAGGENTLAGYLDAGSKAFLFMGKDAGAVRRDAYRKGTLEMVDGVERLSVPETELDLVLPILVRKGYKVGIADKITEGQPKAKIRSSRVKSIVQGELFSDQDFENAGASAIELPANGRSGGMSSMSKPSSMSDEELLKAIGENEEKERGYHIDEYDKRHRQEYDEVTDAYSQMLEENNTSLDDAYSMYSDSKKQWADQGGYATPERTQLLAQIDALEAYIEQKEAERIKLESDEEGARLEQERKETEQRYQQLKEEVRAKGYDLTQLKLRPLEEGETSHVQRRYQENGMFSFTGSEYIESIDDVAFIFKELEDAAVENTFMVLEKDGVPTIIHLAIGSYDAAHAPVEQSLAAFKAIDPDKVWFVHNHPSGNLKSSRQDKDLMRKFHNIFGDKLQDGIIIDTKSGKYGVFQELNDLTSREMPTTKKDTLPMKVYSFSKQVFAPDWNPEEAFSVMSVESIAEFVSSHRLGEHDKMSLIVLDQAGHVTGNVFLPWTAMADAATQQGADLIASYVQQMGGNRVVIYGNYLYNGTKAEKASVRRLNDMLKSRNVRTQDVIHIDRSAYMMGDIAGEPTASEAHDAVDAMLDEVERRKVLAADSVFVSNAMKAVEGIKQEKATPEQWLAMIQKAGGLKAGEDKWIGLSDWLKDKKGSVTKQEVMDFIRANQIRVEEVHYGSDQTEEWAIVDAFNEEFFILQEDAYEDNPDIDADEQIRYAWDEMCRRYGAGGLHGFNNAFRVDDYGRLEIDDFDEAVALANKYKGMNASRPVNDKRLYYTTEGLKNKREIALVVPTVEPWNESDEVHFGDAGNGRAVAWVRFGETTDKDGKRVLVIDEIQSKRHQEGREKGYKTKESVEEEERLGEAVNKAQDAYDAYTRKMGEKYDGAYEDIYSEMTDAEQAEADRLEQEVYSASEKLQNHNISDIPDAPFDKNWHELAMKRMLRYAAENGYDKVAWTKGEQQSKRYDLSKSFNFISYDKDTKKLLAGTLKDGVIDYNFDSIEKKVEPNNLSEYVGKDLAQRLLDNGVIQDEKIHIGGEGMKGFYDQMLPRFMDKYGKKWGVKTGEVDLPDAERSARKMWSVDVTPEMKESVMQGQPMFRRGNARVEKVNTQFNEDLEKLKKGELPSGHVFEMGMPSIPLLSTGIPYAPIRLHSNVLNTKMHDPAHTFTPDEIKDLVKHIQRPIAIFEYGDKEKAQNLMVGIHQATTPEGKQFLVGLALEPVVNDKKLEYNSVRNVFPKNFHDWIHWINQGKLLRVDDKKEIEAIIDALRINPVDYISNDDLNSAAKIVKDFENPKLSDEKIREIYPEYTDAGDEVAEQLGGVKVIWEQQTLEPGTKGWYDPNDNTVHVVIDEVEDVDDVRRTVCHEKLGHEGLAALFAPARENSGLTAQDAANAFGMFIFRSAGKKLRKQILDKADEEGYGWDDPLRLSKAAQEVLADIAADGPRTADEFSLWDKIKHYIIRFANKIGLKVRGLLNDHDLSYYVLKTGEALKRWNKLSDGEKAAMASQETEYDIMRSRRGKPRKKRDESMAQYLQRLREWEKWKTAEETATANGDPMPDKADIDNEWSEKFEADMNEWRSRNNIATDETGPGVFPKRGENETPQEYAIRVAEYETQADVWRGAPNYFDYMQKAQDEYRRRYDEWKRRYDLQEAENVDMAVYEGEGGEGPQTFEDEEAEILAERDMAEAFGVQVDSEGAKRHAKLAVINRRKNLESSNADDAIWLHDFIKKTEELAALMQQQTGQQVTGKMLREALPFIIEGTYWEEALKDEDGNVIGFADISDQLPIKKSPELDELLAHIKEWYDQMFFALEDAGLRGDAGYIGNGYVNHIWDKGKSDPKAWEQYVENYQRTKSPNMKHREVDTYQQGIDVGLVPKFKDIADIIAYYSRSNNEALANKKFLDDLSFMVVEEVNSDGEVVSALPLLSSEKPDAFTADRYVRYHVPGVGDVWVVKDIQKRFANIFGTMRTQDVNKWLETTGKFWDITGSTAKKIELALSGFHALALWEVDVAQNGPVAGLNDLFKYIIVDSVKKNTLPAYAHPEDFKFAATHLVQLGATEDYAAADVNNITGKLREMVMELYHSDSAFKKAAGVAGSVPAILLDWVNKGFDKVLWNYLHDGLKIASMMRFKHQIDRRAEKEGLSDEQREQLYDEAGQYVNDMFGGQYWELLNVSPGTLKWMRRLLLSPDWLVSTNRHFFANFGFGSLYSDGGWQEYLKYNWNNIKRAAGSKVAHDELRRFRSRNAKLCYLVGVLFFWNVLYNALNAWNRKRDEDKWKELAEEMRKTDPSYKSPYELAYPDGMKWYDYTMLGNSLGQQTHLFTGRYDDGTETYVRWGKQFREFPEMFIGRHGLEFPAPLIERMKAKANPNIGGVMDFLGALGVRGFEEGYENREMREKYGRAISVLSATARHFIPFGIPTQADKEYKVMDFFMPSSKGFSRYKTVDYFKTFIIDGDMRGIEQTYKAALMNGVDAEECLKAAIASVKAEQRKELVDGVTDLTGASERFDAATTYKDRSFWKNKMEQYLGGENHQAMQRAAFMENVQRMLDGESADRTWSVATESYLMHATRDDIIEDYRVRVIAKQVADMKHELKNMENSDIDETYIEEYRRRPSVQRLLKADKLLGKYKRSKKKASPGYDALRNKMGGSDDDVLMQQIRDLRHQLIEEVDALE